MATGNHRLIILTALFITTSGFADNYSDAAALSLAGARGATSSTTALAFANAAAANSKAAKDKAAADAKEKADSEKAASAATAAKTPTQAKVELPTDSALPDVLKSVSASNSEPNVLNQGATGATNGSNLGATIAGYTSAIAETGKSASSSATQATNELIAAQQKAMTDHIVQLGMAAAKEVQEMKDRRAARESLKAENEKATADEPKDTGGKIARFPKSAERSLDDNRELATQGGKKNDIDLTSVTAIPEQ